MNIPIAAIAALARGDFENAAVAATPGGIEAQEAAGQAALCASEMLPKKITHGTRADFEALGFQFGKDVDDVFVECKLPAGWRKVPTEHSMHSHVLDEKGRVRVSVFYKAAFYDRNGDMGLLQRYTIRTDCSATDEKFFVTGDAEPRLIATLAKPGPGATQSDKMAWFKASDAAHHEARDWLNTNRPDWCNPTAYWND